MLAGVPGMLLANLSSAQQLRLGKANKKINNLPNVGEFVHLADPITETTVVRLTSVGSNSFLPSATNKFVSVKGRFLTLSSDRSGHLAPYRVDLHSGTVTQIADTQALAPSSLCLNQRRSAVYLIDGGKLQEITLSKGKWRTIAEDVSAFCEVNAGTTAGDPNFAVVRRGRLELLAGRSSPLAEVVDSFCLTRPLGEGCLFSRPVEAGEREYWYTEFSDEATPVLMARGKIANPVWTADGRLLFLRFVPKHGAVISEIHAVNPDGGGERCIASTSQFAAFSPNADASVFVGASGSKAQPTVLLMLADTQRELTLCEHRASHPSAVSPAFSPDSKRVYFQSDREGKSAVYSVNVEALVEPTSVENS